jgi:hypothetical protein
MTARLDCTEPCAAAGKSKAPQIVIGLAKPLLGNRREKEAFGACAGVHQLALAQHLQDRWQVPKIRNNS